MLASLRFTRQEAALHLLRPICSHLLFEAGLSWVEETKNVKLRKQCGEKKKKFVDSPCICIILPDMFSVNTISFGGATLFIQRQNTMFSRCLCLPDAAAPSQTQKELSANISRWYLTSCQILSVPQKLFCVKDEFVLKMLDRIPDSWGTTRLTLEIWTCKNTRRLNQHVCHLSKPPILSLWNGWQLLSSMWNIGFSHFR